MSRKTYGVDGLSDRQCEISVGRARARVHFSGGTATAYRVTPAEYSTSDPVSQRIIENSSYFKEGRIKLIRTDEDNHKSVIRAKLADAVKIKQPDAVSDPTASDHTENDSSQPVNGSIDPDPDPDTILENVEVSCLTDAQNYLRDRFGIPTSKSRSKDKAQAFARENGILFIGI